MSLRRGYAALGDANDALLGNAAGASGGDAAMVPDVENPPLPGAWCARPSAS